MGKSFETCRDVQPWSAMRSRADTGGVAFEMAKRVILCPPLPTLWVNSGGLDRLGHRTLCVRGRIPLGAWGTVSQKAARCNARVKNKSQISGCVRWAGQSTIWPIPLYRSSWDRPCRISSNEVRFCQSGRSSPSRAFCTSGNGVHSWLLFSRV
jgi:hypothetical protein